jgi:hypothetical protein
MNKTTIEQRLFLFLSICLILFVFLILHWEPGSNVPIPRLIEQKAALASGVIFDTAKLVVLDPDTGKEIQPCIPTVVSNQVYQSTEEKNQSDVSDIKSGAEKCTTELIIADTNSALNAALELSKKPIQGEIKKNGKVIPARFVVTLTTLYEGSHCNVINSGGNQYQNCGYHPKRP